MPSTVPSTRTKSPQRKLQDGQAIVLIALLILVLFGMLGLAIDSGRSYVDRRDQQAAVDAAALAAGDWYDNYPNYTDLIGITLPRARQVYANNLHLYSAPTSQSTGTALVGTNNNLEQDTWVDSYSGGYTLTIVATNTLFNGYQFVISSTHQFPLAFMQIFGGPQNVTINATASSIVGNQRQTPALLTLSSQACATNLQGNSSSLTVLGDVYSNGTACVNSNLHLAGNCYGAAGSTCSTALYYCYNASPGFIPYPPPCIGTDILGSPVVPAPSLPDPGYQATSVPYYQGAGLQLDRGSYTEMTPGQYYNFTAQGANSCFFLDAGVYTWNGGYSSQGGLVSNQLKAPNEELWSAPGTTSGAVTQFWSAANCAGNYNLTVVSAPGNGLKHNGGQGNWGIELTAGRFDRFVDPTIGPNPCYNSPGCRRESAPSSCQQVNTIDTNNSGIDINITKNSPGAQYYYVYIDPNGCDGIPNNFSFAGRFLAPGFSDAGGPPAIASGPPWSGTLANGVNGWPCPVAGVSTCNVAYNNLSPTKLCFAQSRTQLCQPPDDELAPQCFASCPPSASVPQENAAMRLQYPPYTGGDVADENYCVVSPNPGDPNAPCTTAKVTPGAVQFYLPNGACLTQNGGGYTAVFSGEQYNWIVIYQPPGATCPAPGGNLLNGNALTQYIGTIYTPSSSWNIQGTDKSPLAGQVICYTATVTGNGAAGIDFNPNYSPAPPAARLIN